MTDAGRDAPRTRAFTALFFVLVALVLLFSDKGQIAGDGETRWGALVALMDEGRLTRDRYTLEMPVAATPLWTAGAAVARLEGESGDARLETIRSVVRRFNKLVAFAIAAWLFGRLRRLGLGETGAAAGVFALLFASLLIPHSKDFYSEPLWTLLVCIALGLLADGPDRTRRGDVALFGAAALAVPLNPLLAPVLCLTASALWLASFPSKEKYAGRGAGIVLVGCASGASIALLENLLRRGALLDFGYSREGFTAPLFEGLLGQLFSPARGALFYLPLFFVGVPLAFRGATPEIRRFCRAGAIFGGLLVLAYAKWHAWHGMTYWGPRFLLPLSVFGAAFLGLAWKPARRAGVLAAGLLVFLLAISFAAYKAGVGIGVTPLRACLLEDPARLACYWDPARAPLSSWRAPGERASMLSHRSTAVETAAAVLFAALAVTARGRRRPSTSPEGPGSR